MIINLTVPKKARDQLPRNVPRKVYQNDVTIPQSTGPPQTTMAMRWVGDIYQPFPVSKPSKSVWENEMIYRLPWIKIFDHSWGDSPTIFFAKSPYLRPKHLFTQQPKSKSICIYENEWCCPRMSKVNNTINQNHQSLYSNTWDSKCLALIAQVAGAFGMNPKIGVSSPTQVRQLGKFDWGVRYVIIFSVL